jgi:hypothetical protein
MAFFADLSPCTYFPITPVDRLLAVGWLDRDRSYRRASVDETVFARLCELLHDPWQPFVTPGAHDCPFCRFTGGPAQLNYRDSTVQLGANNLFVSGDGVLLVAPSLILHYIDAHEYAPPEQFCQAVLNCPPMRSMAYWKAIREHGPPGLVGQSHGS